MLSRYEHLNDVPFEFQVFETAEKEMRMMFESLARRQAHFLIGAEYRNTPERIFRIDIARDDLQIAKSRTGTLSFESPKERR
jgi:hypothetical protein